MATRTKQTVDRLDMAAVEQLALTRFKADKGARDDVSPGEYEGRLQLEVKYQIKVGEDYTGTHPASVPWMDIASVLMSKVNDATMASILREVLDGEVDTSEVKRQAEAAMNAIVGTTEKLFRGKVTGTTHVLRVTAL